MNITQDTLNYIRKHAAYEAHSDAEDFDGGYEVGMDGPDFAYEAGVFDGEIKFARRVLSMFTP